MRLKLGKSHKLCSATAIDALFASAAPGRSALAFPLRMVWSPRPAQVRSHLAEVQFFISVPKKRLRHAVDRVQMRRRIREAYRLNRELWPQGRPLDVAFIYVGPTLQPYAKVDRAMKKLLPLLSAE